MSSQHSPWKNTKIIDSLYLDILSIRPVPASINDTWYNIGQSYHLRPDLLAYDLYHDHRLWWVFAQRNMNILEDPIYDFTTGTGIYLPDATEIGKYFG